MSFDQYTQEQLQEMSLIELAYELLLTEKQAKSFNEIVTELKKMQNMSDKKINSVISQFYTDLNIDGRFICLGENRWGLRPWYPYDQIDEEVVAPVKPKKKKKAKKKAVKKEKDLDVEELDEDEIEFDDDIVPLDEDDADDLDDDADFDDVDEFDDDIDEDDEDDDLDEDEDK